MLTNANQWSPVFTNAAFGASLISILLHSRKVMQNWWPIAKARVSSHLWEAHDPIKGTLLLDNLFKEVLRAVPASVCDSVTLLILNESNSSTSNITCSCVGACAGSRCENIAVDAGKLADTVLPSLHSTTHSKDPQNRVSHLLVLGHLRHWGHLHTPMLELEQDYIAKAADCGWGLLASE